MINDNESKRTSFEVEKTGVPAQSSAPAEGAEAEDTGGTEAAQSAEEMSIKSVEEFVAWAAKEAGQISEALQTRSSDSFLENIKERTEAIKIHLTWLTSLLGSFGDVHLPLSTGVATQGGESITKTHNASPGCPPPIKKRRRP